MSIDSLDSLRKSYSNINKNCGNLCTRGKNRRANYCVKLLVSALFFNDEAIGERMRFFFAAF